MKKVSQLISLCVVIFITITILSLANDIWKKEESFKLIDPNLTVSQLKTLIPDINYEETSETIQCSIDADSASFHKFPCWIDYDFSIRNQKLKHVKYAFSMYKSRSFLRERFEKIQNILESVLGSPSRRWPYKNNKAYRGMGHYWDIIGDNYKVTILHKITIGQTDFTANSGRHNIEFDIKR